MDKLRLLVAVVIVQFVCEIRADDCPDVATRPHATQCNQYIKCAELPSMKVTWITMKCQEGLIYDKNLRSCAIPGDDWECRIDNDEDNESDFEQDESNVYGIDNLEVIQEEPEKPEDEEFLEVIGDQSFGRSVEEEVRDESEDFEGVNLDSDDKLEARFDISEDEPSESSGDGVAPETVTQSTSTSRMITTQLQRLTQLMQHVQDKNNGVIDDEDVTPEDLNSFLATQKVQSSSLEYQKIDFQSKDKTPMPSNGRIHPEILSDILDQQSQLSQEANYLTTLAMDATTQKYPKRRPAYYETNEPITEIKMKSAQSLDGTGSHQIVVNRPEGSVLFNVPPSQDHSSNQPYLSQDILKTILEISKQMVTQNHQKQNPQVSYAPQPFYYAVPVPYLSPQNNVPNFYSHDYRNNLTESPVEKKTSVQIIPAPSTTKFINKIKERLPEFGSNFNLFQKPLSMLQPQPQQQYPIQSMPTKYNPNYYYNNYPSYSNGFPNYQNYHSNNYQYPSKNQFSNPLNYQQQYNNFDSNYYVEQPIQQQPNRKESYATYDEEKIDENLYEDVELDEPSVKSEKEELICSYVVQRQANKTDCYRYYVCNAKTKEVLSYTCPIFTAFNDQTKYCDALSYPTCKKTKDRMSDSVSNQKIINEAQAALQKVKMETQKVQRIAQRVREQSQNIYKRRNPYQDYQNNFEEDEAPTSYSSNSQVQKVPKPLVRPTPSPSYIAKPKPIRKSTKKKSKKVKCRNVGNIVDPESSYSYWHCFKGPDGRMKRINRKCSGNFVFCPSSRYCSPEDKCNEF